MDKICNISPDDLKVINYKADNCEGWERLVGDRPKRLEYASKLKMPHLIRLEPHSGKVAIVGASPSIVDYADKIKTFQEEGGFVMPINGAHNWLISNGIIPNIHVIFEIDMDAPEEFLGGPPHKDVYYYVCSHSSQKLFDSLEGHHRVLWHHYDKSLPYQEVINRLFPDEFMVSGGYMTFFRVLNIALVLGFRKLEFFGCDSSYEGKSHPENYHSYAREPVMIVAAGTKENNRVFKTNPSLSFLASEFMRFCDINQCGLSIKVHGDGMLRHLHEMEYPEQYS